MGTPENSQELTSCTDGRPEAAKAATEVAETDDQKQSKTVAGVAAGVRVAAVTVAAVTAAKNSSPLTDGLYHCEGSSRNAFGAGRDTMFPPPDEAA